MITIDENLKEEDEKKKNYGGKPSSDPKQIEKFMYANNPVLNSADHICKEMEIIILRFKGRNLA